MYTVLRLTCADKEKLSDLIKIGERMELLKKDSFTGLRKNSNWFACTLAKDPDFEAHLKEIRSNINLYLDEIKHAVKLGIFISIDLALAGEDFKNFPYISVGFDNDFLKFLNELNISLEVTVYRP
jgi:hypothetical protein